MITRNLLEQEEESYRLTKQPKLSKAKKLDLLDINNAIYENSSETQDSQDSAMSLVSAMSKAYNDKPEQLKLKMAVSS